MKSTCQRFYQYFILLAIIQLLNLSQAYIDCPYLDVEAKVSADDVCYEHPGVYPIDVIKAGIDCFDNSKILTSQTQKICPLNILDGTYAWVNESFNIKRNTQNEVLLSKAMMLKKSKAQCKEVSAYRQNLLPGRDCSKSYQCLSKLCDELVCSGFDIGQNCHSHADCKAGLYCDTSTQWPFQSICTQQKNDSISCYEDYECGNDHICWYQSADDRKTNSKVCLLIYSQPDGTKFGWYSNNTQFPALKDYERNGKYCNSGLAHPTSDYEANCTSIDKVFQSGNELKYPYQCVPNDPTQQCQLQFFFNTSNNYITNKTTNRTFVNVPCRCALDDKDKKANGYCGSVIGSAYYRKSVEALKNVLSASQCHTMDRDNMRAQKNICGIGTKTEDWRFAVDKMFNVTYWPYIQNNTQYKKIQQIFSDSFENLELDFALLSFNHTFLLSLFLLLLLIFSN